MSKNRLKIIGLALLGVALTLLPGCGVDLSVPGGGTWPSLVRMKVEIVNVYDSVSISWEGNLIETTVVPGVGTIGGDDTASGSWQTGTPLQPPFTHSFPLTEKLTAGLWRFEIKITGDNSTVTVMCDQEISSSGDWDHPLVLDITVSRTGCVSNDLLRATSIVTDFSEYTAGQAPYDWSKPGNPADITWTVNSGTGIGGKQMEGDQTTAGARFVTWDNSPIQADAEVLAKIMTHSTAPTIPSPVIALRAQGGGPAFAAYFAALQGGNKLIIGRLRSGVQQQLTGQAYYLPYSVGTWYWIRFRVDGNDPAHVLLKAKVWEVGSSEPNLFTLPIQDPDSAGSITGPGLSGILTFDAASDPHVDFFSVGIAGSHALPHLDSTCEDQTPPYYVCP